MIVELGANDALRGVSPDVTRANLDAILTKLKARPNTQCCSPGMISPPNMGPDMPAKFNPIYGELARQARRAALSVLLEGVAGNGRLNQADYMHPNAEAWR